MREALQILFLSLKGDDYKVNRFFEIITKTSSV